MSDLTVSPGLGRSLKDGGPGIENKKTKDLDGAYVKPAESNEGGRGALTKVGTALPRPDRVSPVSLVLVSNARSFRVRSGV
jgi:hypothetical protein